MTEKEKLEVAFRAGAKEGARRFAWWMGGVEYVGTCGKTLKTALKEMDAEPVIHVPGWEGD